MFHVAYSDRYVLPLPEGHKFPMLKYELVKEQLIYEGTLSPKQIFDPGLIDLEHVYRAHNPTYVGRFRNLQLTDSEIRRIGFPMTELTVKRCFYSAAGTFKGSQYALQEGIALNIAGGTHHAMYDCGEGFCMLNDQAIAALYLYEVLNIAPILIFDLDVHQGNGTAQILYGHPSIYTVSIHGADNFPLRKVKSYLDIAIPTGTTDDAYLQSVEQTLISCIQKIQPKFIFYQAGVDILDTDKLGKLSVSRQGCKERDELVLSTAHKLNIPIMVTMGGGYSPKIIDIVEAHCNTFRVAAKYWG